MLATFSQALHLAGSNFLVGLIGAALLYLLCWVGGRVYELSQREERERPERFEEIDLSGEFRVIDRTRRGPERIVGPEGRERLPLSGRRMA